MKKWKVRVIHFSHTDIGYKDTQSRIINQQSKNLKNVIDKFKQDKYIDKYWKWNVESFGTLEDFIGQYKEYENDLVKLIREDKIGISANYWNFSKLASREVISSAFKRVLDFNKKYNLNINSLVTNDINGYAKSWAEEANKNGIENLFFGLHTHHGYFPAFKKQAPFYWKLANGKKSLVWIGEQYAFGNNMGIVPGPMSDYIAKDELTAGYDEKEQIQLANKRIKEYTEKLLDDGYEFDVIPITVLGTGSDNDPANFDISKRLELLRKEWKQFGVDEIEMVTLDEFFKEIRAESKNIPVYEGEWPDWWTDGIGSNPQAARAFREAQRNYKFIRRIGTNVSLDQLEKDLLLFSEHTFGTEDPIRYNHSQYNFNVEKIKGMFAYRALNSTLNIIDKETGWESQKTKEDSKIYLSIENPYKSDIKQNINITRFFGLKEKDDFLSLKNKKITSNGENINFSVEITPHPAVKAWSEKDIILNLELKANEIKNIEISTQGERTNGVPMTSSFSTVTAELADDVENINNPKSGIKFDGKILETDYYKIKFGRNGITSIVNKENNKDILFDKNESLFQPIYLVDKVDYKNRNELFLQRRRVGKNRLAPTSKQFNGELLSKLVEIENNGKNTKITLNYSIECSKFYEVIINLNNFNNLIEATINMNKDTEWSMESMFISLPFSGKLELDYDGLYEVDKGQIPGTLIDYHSIQEGFVVGDIAVSQLDAPLVWTTDFEYRQRDLANNNKMKTKGLYTWAMNNVWETNFSADTSGFHSFRYRIEPINNKNQKNVSEKLLGNAGPLFIKRKEI